MGRTSRRSAVHGNQSRSLGGGGSSGPTSAAATPSLGVYRTEASPASGAVPSFLNGALSGSEEDEEERAMRAAATTNAAAAGGDPAALAARASLKSVFRYYVADAVFIIGDHFAVPRDPADSSQPLNSPVYETLSAEVSNALFTLGAWFFALLMRRADVVLRGCSPVAFETLVVLCRLLTLNEGQFGWQLVKSGVVLDVVDENGTMLDVRRRSTVAGGPINPRALGGGGSGGGGGVFGSQGSGGGLNGSSITASVAMAKRLQGYGAFFSRTAFSLELCVWALLGFVFLSVQQAQRVVMALFVGNTICWNNVSPRLGVVLMVLFFGVVWVLWPSCLGVTSSVGTLQSERSMIQRVYTAYSFGLSLTSLLTDSSVAQEARARVAEQLLALPQRVARMAMAYPATQKFLHYANVVVEAVLFVDLYFVAGIAFWYSLTMLESSLAIALSGLFCLFCVLPSLIGDGWTEDVFDALWETAVCVGFYVVVATGINVLVPRPTMPFVAASLRNAVLLLHCASLSGRHMRRLQLYAVVWLALVCIDATYWYGQRLPKAMVEANQKRSRMITADYNTDPPIAVYHNLFLRARRFTSIENERLNINLAVLSTMVLIGTVTHAARELAASPAAATPTAKRAVWSRLWSLVSPTSVMAAAMMGTASPPPQATGTAKVAAGPSSSVASSTVAPATPAPQQSQSRNPTRGAGKAAMTAVTGSGSRGKGTVASGQELATPGRYTGPAVWPPANSVQSGNALLLSDDESQSMPPLSSTGMEEETTSSPPPPAATAMPSQSFSPEDSIHVEVEPAAASAPPKEEETEAPTPTAASVVHEEVKATMEAPPVPASAQHSGVAEDEQGRTVKEALQEDSGMQTGKTSDQSTTKSGPPLHVPVEPAKGEVEAVGELAKQEDAEETQKKEKEKEENAEEERETEVEAVEVSAGKSTPPAVSMPLTESMLTTATTDVASAINVNEQEATTTVTTTAATSRSAGDEEDSAAAGQFITPVRTPMHTSPVPPSEEDTAAAPAAEKAGPEVKEEAPQPSTTTTTPLNQRSPVASRKEEAPAAPSTRSSKVTTPHPAAVSSLPLPLPSPAFIPTPESPAAAPNATPTLTPTPAANDGGEGTAATVAVPRPASSRPASTKVSTPQIAAVPLSPAAPPSSSPVGKAVVKGSPTEVTKSKPSERSSPVKPEEAKRPKTPVVTVPIAGAVIVEDTAGQIVNIPVAPSNTPKGTSASQAASASASKQTAREAASTRAAQTASTSSPTASEAPVAPIQPPLPRSQKEVTNSATGGATQSAARKPSTKPSKEAVPRAMEAAATASKGVGEGEAGKGSCTPPPPPPPPRSVQMAAAAASWLASRDPSKSTTPKAGATTTAASASANASTSTTSTAGTTVSATTTTTKKTIAAEVVAGKPLALRLSTETVTPTTLAALAASISSSSSSGGGSKNRSGSSITEPLSVPSPKGSAPAAPTRAPAPVMTSAKATAAARPEKDTASDSQSSSPRSQQQAAKTSTRSPLRGVPDPHRSSPGSGKDSKEKLSFPLPKPRHEQQASSCSSRGSPMAGYGEGGSPGSTKATTTAASSTMSTPLAPPPVAPPSRLRAGDEESNSNAASPSQSKEPSKPSAASSAAVPLPRSQRMAEEKESSASAGTTSSARPNTSPAESTSADSATRKDRAGCAMSKEGASAEVKRLTRESSAMEETSSVSSPSAGAGAGGGGGTGLQSPSSALRPQSSSSQYTAATSSFTTASDSTAAAMKLSTRKPKSVAGSQDSNGLVAHSITVQDLYSLFKTREEAQRVAATAQSEAPRTSSSSISASPPAGVDDAPTSLPLTERVLAAPLVTSAEVTPAGDVTKAASTLSTPYPASTVMTVTTPTPAGEAAPAAPTAAATPSAHFLAALPREPSHPSLRDDDEDMTFYLPDHIASSDDEDGYSRGSTPHRESGAAIAAQYLLSSSQPQSHSSLPSTMEPYESIFGDNSTQSLLQLLQGATMASSHPIAAAGTRGGEGHHQPVPIHLEHDEQMTKEALENIANAFTTIALPREQVASVHGSQEDSRAAMQQPALVSSVPGLTSACTPYTTAIMAAPDASGGTTPHPTPVPVAAAVSPQPESSFTFSVTSNPQPPHVPVSPAHVVKGTVSSERSGRRRPPSKETKSPPITASTNMPTVSVGVSSLSTAALRTTAKPQEQGTWSVRGSEHITSPSHGGDSARRGGPGGNGGNAAAGAGQGQGAGGGGGGRRGRDHGSSATASSAHSLGLALRGMEIPQVPAPSQQQQQQQSQEDNLPVPVPTATAASASLSTSFGGTTVAPLTSLVRGGVPGAATGSSVSSTHLNPAGTSPGPTQLSASLGSSQLRPPSPSQAVSSHQISQQPQQQQQTQFVQIQQPIAAFTTAGAVAQASTNANNGGGGVTQGSVLLSAPGQGQTMMLVTLPDGRLAVCPVVYTAPTQQAVYVSPGYTATSTPNGLQLVSQGSGGSGGGYPVQVVYRSANGGSGNGGGSEQVQTHYLMLSQPNSQQ